MKRLAIYIVVRYTAVILASFLLPYFYFILAPLTIYPAYILLKLLFGAELLEISFQGVLAKTIIFDGKGIVFISSCIAASAYYLLFLLNLTTAKIKIKKRILTMLFDFAIFLLLNIFRISILAMLIGTEIFSSAHWLFWHVLSTVFVVLIWLFTIKIFEIRETPVYSDFIFLLKAIKKKSKIDKVKENFFKIF